MDRQGAVAALKAAVAAFVSDHAAGDERWCVALSGGADSLALTAVAAACQADHCADRRPSAATRLRRVAATARDQAMSVGCVDAQVLCVDVGTAGGPEAAARTARYRALDDARGDAPVLLAHTLDDQAETVLLGLGRGSGSRSIAGHAAVRSAVVSPAAGRPSCAHPRRMRRVGAHAVAGPAQRRSPVHPHAAAHRGAAAARGGARRRRRRSAGPHRDRAARRHRRRSTNWPGRRWPTSAPGAGSTPPGWRHCRRRSGAE